jgi:acyl carrier protein
MARAQGEGGMSALAAARRLLADALAVAESKLPADARIGAVEQWDSLGHTRILLAIEERLGRPLDAEVAIKIESLEDVARAIDV